MGGDGPRGTASGEPSGAAIVRRPTRQIGRCDIAEALIGFVIYLVVICVVAGIVLWAVARFFPEVYPPARMIVGAVALIAILVLLLRAFRGGGVTVP